jgi:hypothetical protein
MMQLKSNENNGGPDAGVITPDYFTAGLYLHNYRSKYGNCVDKSSLRTYLN